MDDQHRQPRDGDRNPVRARIKRAVAEGRISAADGEIRLTNVGSAQSISELGLIVRDLDQLEAAITAAPAMTAPVPGYSPAAPVPGINPVASAAAGGVRRTLPLLIVGLAIAIIAAGAIGLVAFSSSEKTATGPGNDGLSAPLPIGEETPSDGCPTWPRCTTEPGEEPVNEPGKPAVTYRLDAAGIRGFLADYRERFSTTKVVDLSLYGEYVIVRVPEGKNRSSGWRYANGEFDDFGGTRANFPGSGQVDTSKLNLAKLMRNIATARRTLKVEEINLTYVSLNYRPDFDDAPNVNIYVTNEYSESGYLATTLDGRVERAYPFSG